MWPNPWCIHLFPIDNTNGEFIAIFDDLQKHLFSENEKLFDEAFGKKLDTKLNEALDKKLSEALD